MIFHRRDAEFAPGFTEKNANLDVSLRRPGGKTLLDFDNWQFRLL